MPGLAASRWNTGGRPTTYLRPQPSRIYNTTTVTHAISTSTTQQQPQQQQLPPSQPIVNSDRTTASFRELQRFLRIVRRLKWKIPDLARGYREAVDRIGPHVDRQQAEEAALMFKLDFFEYYMLIERALVHLLGVFGIQITRHFKPGTTTQSAPRTGINTPNRTSTPVYTHRYHENVLEALDNPENPLHIVLGTGPVRKQFSRAKELRNRWKYIDEREDERTVASTNTATPLESYNVEQIILDIFEGFDRAYILAEQFVIEEQRRVKNGVAPVVSGEMMDGLEVGSTEEEQWDFYTEAMDWDAV